MFFWGIKDGKPKKKWSAWGNICRLIKEMGLGLRNLEDMQVSLHLKLAWNLLQASSLWVKFLISKYIGVKHISLVSSNK